MELTMQCYKHPKTVVMIFLIILIYLVAEEYFFRPKLPYENKKHFDETASIVYNEQP